MDKDDDTIRGYRMSVALGHLTPALRDEIVGMWLAEGVLAVAEANRRVGEVVLVARAPDGQLAGVNTAYVAAAPASRAPYWFYRTFVRESHRGVWGLGRGMLGRAIEVLRTHVHPEHPRGVVAVVENPRIMRKGSSAVIERSGMVRLGRDAQGRDVWCLNFDGSVPVTPPGLVRDA